MTAAELIEKLKTMPQDTPVWFVKTEGPIKAVSLQKDDDGEYVQLNS